MGYWSYASIKAPSIHGIGSWGETSSPSGFCGEPGVSISIPRSSSSMPKHCTYSDILARFYSYSYIILYN
jgi:hypothetical protein